MEVYSKEKTVSAFLRKLTDEKLRDNIRPYIDKKQIEIIQLIRLNKIPLYYKELGKEVAYAALFISNHLFAQRSPHFFGLK